MLLKFKLKHLPSGTYDTVILKGHNRKCWLYGAGGVRSNLMSFMQVFKSLGSQATAVWSQVTRQPEMQKLNKYICNTLLGVSNFLTKTSLSHHPF